MDFKQLVARFYEGDTSWSELIAEVKCESCFASVMDEMNEQLGAASKAPSLLANTFPDFYDSYAKERGLND